MERDTTNPPDEEPAELETTPGLEERVIREQPADEHRRLGAEPHGGERPDFGPPPGDVREIQD